MYICAYVYVDKRIHVSTNVWRSEIDVEYIFLFFHLSSFETMPLLLYLKLDGQARLCGQEPPAILLCLHPYRYAPLLPECYVDAGSPDLGPHVCAATLYWWSHLPGPHHPFRNTFDFDLERIWCTEFSALEQISHVKEHVTEKEICKLVR